MFFTFPLGSICLNVSEAKPFVHTVVTEHMHKYSYYLLLVIAEVILYGYNFSHLLNGTSNLFNVFIMGVQIIWYVLLAI